MKCWWCLHDANCNLHLPTNYCKKTDKFTCIGQFCSWECMKAYNLNDSTAFKYIRSSYITMMYQRFCNRFDIIKEAPPRELLDIFGGPLTIDKFRQNNCTYTILPNLINRSKLNVDKQINYKWINEVDADKSFNSTQIKNTINPLKIKNEDSNKNSTKKGIFAFDSFVK